MGPTGAEKLYNTLIEDLSPRRRRSFEVIWQALNELRAEGSLDYSIALVGRRVEKLGGPRTQSLRNKGGAEFRRLIQAFATSPLSAPGIRGPAETQVEKAIREIPDLGVQTVLRMTLEENRRLKHELDMLRRAFRDLQVDTTRDGEAGESSGTVQGEVLEGATVTARIPKVAIASVERFLSITWMEERGWRIEPDGSIVDETLGGTLLAPSHFVDALRSIVSTRARARAITLDRNDG